MFSVMWSELLMTSAISCPLWSSVYECQRVECAFTSPVRTECGMFVMYCLVVVFPGLNPACGLMTNCINTSLASVGRMLNLRLKYFQSIPQRLHINTLFNMSNMSNMSIKIRM